LGSHPKAALTIEGHCDEQGTTEYNIGLGQRRAQNMADYLRRLGTDPTRVHAFSFGAERPAVEGHDELAWSKNRRGELRVAP
jgi:peptidoglycan-associated lipoprotein